MKGQKKQTFNQDLVQLQNLIKEFITSETSIDDEVATKKFNKEYQRIQSQKISSKERKTLLLKLEAFELATTEKEKKKLKFNLKNNEFIDTKESDEEEVTEEDVVIENNDNEPPEVESEEDTIEELGKKLEHTDISKEEFKNDGKKELTEEQINEIKEKVKREFAAELLSHHEERVKQLEIENNLESARLDSLIKANQRMAECAGVDAQLLIFWQKLDSLELAGHHEARSAAGRIYWGVSFIIQDYKDARIKIEKNEIKDRLRELLNHTHEGNVESDKAILNSPRGWKMKTVLTNLVAAVFLLGAGYALGALITGRFALFQPATDSGNKLNKLANLVEGLGA